MFYFIIDDRLGLRALYEQDNLLAMVENCKCVRLSCGACSGSKCTNKHYPAFLKMEKQAMHLLHVLAECYSVQTLDQFLLQVTKQTRLP